MRKFLVLLIVGLVSLALARDTKAQSPVQTNPVTGTTNNGNASGTVAVNNVFQRIWAAGVVGSSPPPRKGCTIINNSGANKMWVTEALGVAGSTQAKAVPLVPGQAYFCAQGVTVLIGEIDITGTAGDAFYAAQW